MNLNELVSRFPEIPSELRTEPVLTTFAAECGDVLAVAQKPSPCSTGHDASNHYYLRLIGPLSIYGYGLSSLDQVISKMQTMIDRHRENPDGFAASLLPADVADQETKGPGCA